MYTTRGMIAVTMLLAFVSLPASGVDSGSAIKGTALTVGNDRLVVRDDEGRTVSIEINDETRVLDMYAVPVDRSNLREGDRVVVEVMSSGSSTIAKEISFAHPESEPGTDVEEADREKRDGHWHAHWTPRRRGASMRNYYNNKNGTNMRAVGERRRNRPASQP